jgi:5-methylcytosine-specific restriction enzyme A
MTYTTRKRKEFTRQTKREALERSRGECEAVGTDYNLAPDARCNFPFGLAVEYDHVDSSRNDGNSLANCNAVCISCHAYKTAKIDSPKHAKIKRVSDKHHGITRPRHKWPSRKFSQPRFNNDKIIERY